MFNLHILVDFPTFPSTINFLFHCIVTGKSSLYDLSLFRVDFGEGNGTNSSTLARKIPWTEEPGRLQSTGLLRVGND